MLRSVHGTGFSPFTRYIRVTQNVAIPTLSTSIDLTMDTVSYVLVEPRLKEKEGTLYSIEVGSISGPEWQTSFAGTSLLFFFFWVQQNRLKINRENITPATGRRFLFQPLPRRDCVSPSWAYFVSNVSGTAQVRLRCPCAGLSRCTTRLVYACHVTTTGAVLICKAGKPRRMTSIVFGTYPTISAHKGYLPPTQISFIGCEASV